MKLAGNFVPEFHHQEAILSLNPKYIRFFKRGFLFFAFSTSIHFAYSQETRSAKSVHHIAGAVTVTNTGVSLVPTFSLGKPAALFDLSVGNEKLSFEPEFRFALEGKPWCFIFWWRYKLINNEKFKVDVGAHPSFLFKTVIGTTNGGVTSETQEAERYVSVELSPRYFLTKNISIGMYYLQGHGFVESSIKNSHFLTINSNFSNIKLSEQFYMKFHPQVYYLRMDGNDGFYITASLTFAKRDFPLTLQSIVNQPFESNIPGGNDFVWNVSLIYSFRKEYEK